MTIYERLHSDHEALKPLLNQLKIADSVESRKSLLTQIRDALVPHSRAEEAVFYNGLRETKEGKDVVTHSYMEHVEAETLLRALQITENGALHWQKGVEKLREALLHHISEEEGKVFAVGKKVLSEEEAVLIGDAFEKLKPQLGAGVVTSNIELSVNLLPLRFRKSVTEFLTTTQGPTHKKAS